MLRRNTPYGNIIYMLRLLENDRKTSFLTDLFSRSRYMKRVQLFNARYTKGIPFVKNSIQLFREKLSQKICTRQSRKVIWDMINTLFLTTVPVEPTFVAFLQHSQTHFHGLSCQFFQISLKKRELKTTHNAFQDCRVHFSRQPFSKQLYIRVRDWTWGEASPNKALLSSLPPPPPPLLLRAFPQVDRQLFSNVQYFEQLFFRFKQLFA